MSARHRLDDRTVDSLLSGRVPAGSEEFADVAVLAMRLRASAEQAPSPRPSPALAEVLAGGLPATADKVPARAAGKAAPRERAAPREWRVRGRPTGRVRSPRRGIAVKLAGLTLVAKLALATTAVAVTTAGAGFAGVLPSQFAQEAFDRAFRGGVVPMEVPEEVDRLPADEDTLPQRNPAMAPSGADDGHGPAPIPDAPSSRSEGPGEPLQDRAPADAPPIPQPGQGDEQPGSSREAPEPGPRTDPVRPEEPPAPHEEGRAEPEPRSDEVPGISGEEPGPDASALEEDGPHNGGGGLAPDQVVPVQDRPNLSADPAGAPRR